METDSKQQRVARTPTFSVLQRLHRAAESQNKDTQRRRIRRLHAIRVGGGPFEGLQLGGGLEPDRIGRRRHGTVTVRTARVHRSVLGRVPVRVGVRVDSVREGVRVGRKEVPGRQEVRAQGGTADEQWRATATPRAATTRPAADCSQAERARRARQPPTLPTLPTQTHAAEADWSPRSPLRGPLVRPVTLRVHGVVSPLLLPAAALLVRVRVRVGVGVGVRVLSRRISVPSPSAYGAPSRRVTQAIPQ